METVEGLESRHEVPGPVLFALFGASNLTLCLPSAINHLLLRFGSRRLRLYVAHGIGRSYGIEAGILGFQLPGIVQCGLLDALEDAKKADQTCSVLALVTDIGNDIMYGIAPDLLNDWVARIISRLSQLDATIVVTSVPLQGLLRLPAWQFHLFRRLF